MKEWIKSIFIFLTLWSLINSIHIGLVLSMQDDYFGQTNFFKAFAISAIVELSFFTALGLIIYMTYKLVKKVSKGLREEKKHYRDRHRNKRK